MVDGVGTQRSPMSLSSALRESDLPFIPSLLSLSLERSFDERSRSLDDLGDKSSSIFKFCSISIISYIH